MKPVTVYFDYASPWSYLVSEVAARKLAGIEVDWVPIYIRGLPAFAAGMPYPPGKLSYLVRDLMRVVRHEGVAFAQPATFPIDSIHALRGALVAKEQSAGAFARFHRAAFRAAWQKQVDIADRKIVAATLLEAVGPDTLNASDIAVSFSAQRYKDQLRTNTDDAIRRGVFGLPMFYVGDEAFWGHDRIDYVARAARDT